MKRCESFSPSSSTPPPFSRSPPAPPAPPLHLVELWACPKWTLPACRTSISSPLSLDSTAPGPSLAHTQMLLMIIIMMIPMMKTLPSPREELGLMSCDDISRYSVSSQSGSKGSEAVSYYLDQDSGQYFSLLEGDGPPGPDYDRGRNTGVRRRDKTPTHGKTESAVRQCERGSVTSLVLCLFCRTACSLPPVFSSFSQSSSSFITHLMALLLCVFTTRKNVPKETLITCQRVSPTTLCPAPCLPHHLCHTCPRPLPRHPVPSLETLKGPVMCRARVM